MKILFNILTIIFASQLVLGQSKTETSSIKFNVVELDSKYFPNQKRTIKIYVPKKYDSSKKISSNLYIRWRHVI